MKAIPWDYDGIPFRSKLEAKWYAVFKLMGMKNIQYEPGCVNLEVSGWKTPTINYLPDFLIDEVYIEIKPLLEAYSDRDHESVWKAMILGYSAPAMVIIGDPKKFVAFKCTDRHKGSPFGFVLDGSLKEKDEFFLHEFYPDEEFPKKFPFEKFFSLFNANEFALDAEKLIQWKPKN